MTYTAARTWVVGDKVTHTDLNEQIKANLDFLSTHQHSGAPGDGGTVFPGLDSVTNDDITTPSAPGANMIIVYTVSGVPSMRIGAAGAEVAITDENHTHTAAS